ncbi:MAG: O-antigen ligase family protein [Patescibacteria group bacterium]
MRALRANLFPWLVYVALFLLPWQTRYIFDQKLIGGEPFEYGTLSVYAVELLVLAAFFLGQRLMIRREHQVSVKTIGIVLLAVAISIPFSFNADLSLNAWMHLVFAGALFCLLLDQRVDRTRAMTAFVLGLIGPAVLGLFQFFSGWSPLSTIFGLAFHEASQLGASVIESEAGRQLRAYGSFSHPNVFGGYLAIGLLLTFFLASRHKTRFTYFLQLPLVSLFSFTFILTFSRSAWLAFLAAAAVGIFFIVRQHRALIRTHAPRLGLTALLLAAASLIFITPFVNRFDPNERLEQISVSERVHQYQAFPLVVNHDLLTGVGVGAYTLALAEIKPSQPAWSYQPIHNVPLLVLGEVGIVGALAMIFWAVTVDRVNYAAIRRRSVTAIGGIVLGTVPLVIIFFDHYLWSSWQGLALLMFLMAMTLRLSE